MRQLFEGLAMVAHQGVVHVETDVLDLPHVESAVNENLLGHASTIPDTLPDAKSGKSLDTKRVVGEKRVHLFFGPGSSVGRAAD